MFSLFFSRQHPQAGSAYLPINVDGSPGKSLRGAPPPPSSVPPPVSVVGLGRSGSPAGAAGGQVAPPPNLIRQPYPNYAVASAVAAAANASNHRAPPGGGPQAPSAADHVRSYYQGALVTAAASGGGPVTIPSAVAANIGQQTHYTTASRVDPTATVFVRNPVRQTTYM